MNVLLENDAKYVIREVVEGLNYLSTHNIMHRDIKLDNILATRKQNNQGFYITDYEFKLGDMGLAKSMNSPNAMNDTFAGTPLAMAPELLNGNKYSYKADVWSLGTLLFQILAGHHPFTGRNMTELKQNLKAGAYKIPKNIEISMNCIDFLNSCLRFDYVQRSDWEQLKQHDFLAGSNFDN